MRCTGVGLASRRGGGLAAACLAAAVASLSCSRTDPADTAEAQKRRGDGLFLARAPVYIPDDLEPDLDAMGVKRIYAAAASLAKDGRIVPLPPPPTPLVRPVVLTVVGEEDAAAQLGGVKGEILGAIWAKGIAQVLSDARSWGRVVGVHIHFAPSADHASTLAAAIRSLKAAIPDVPVSVTVPPEPPPSAWKPLAGAADELLVFAFGRRPELGGQLVQDLPEEAAKEMPLRFRLLLAPGGYGRTGDGTSWSGGRVSDRKVDELSEDRSLDFHFGQVLSSEPGSLYTFRPREGTPGGEGRFVRFQLLSASDAVRFLGAVSRWSVPRLQGRVFLVEGVPADGFLLGFKAVRAMLTGKSLEPRLEASATPGAASANGLEFSITARYTAPAPTDLSHYNNWLQVRVEGGVFQAVRATEFDRFELLTAESDGARPTTFSRAVICRLYENFFAPDEVKQAGPFRITGGHPKAFVSYHLSAPDGKVVKGAEQEIPLPQPEVRAPAPRRGR